MKVLKTLSRLYVNDLNTALEFYEYHYGYPVFRRLELPQLGLELVHVEDILLVVGSDEAFNNF